MKRICFLSLTPLRSLALLFLLLVLAPSRTSTRSPPSASPLSALTIRHRVFPSNVTTLPPPPPPDLQINSLSLSPLYSSLSDTFPLSLALVFCLSSHVPTHLFDVKEVTHHRNPTQLMRPGTFWILMEGEIFPKYFFFRLSLERRIYRDLYWSAIVRLIKHCKFKCRESIGRINLKLCEYFSPLLAIEQFPGTASKRSSDLVASEILRSRYPSMYSSSKVS